MATAKRPPGKGGRKKSSKVVAWVTWLSIGLVVVGCVVAGLLNGSESTDVPAPAVEERTDTVPILERAEASQGICYGWRLDDGLDVVSVGSNLGDGVSVEDAPGCPRWVQVVAAVTYTSENSESEDSAYVRITGSDDISGSDLHAIEDGLKRFGLPEDAFVDDPGWAVTRAAVMLPLLAVEAGLAEPAPTPTAAAVSPSPLPDAGSDLWRDRWGYLFAAAGLLLLCALLVTVGVVQRRRQLRPAGPAQRPGAEASARTPEQA
ncbi:hypothetical protein [Micromonospora sp. DT47]|uniref:hypothetical protein n=1 Tax=Micromonospora sp. DT47 TaxID=3393431 RepID=UPI003CF70729